MKSIFVAYFSTLAVFLGCDMVWLGAMASRFYRPLLGDMALVTPRLPPAAVFYAMYPLGILFFCVLPAEGAG